jgi:acetyl-CoA C-acetyltransferase
MNERSVVFAEPIRTAIGTFGGNLKDVPAPSLGAVAIGGAVARAGIRPDEVQAVVMGNVIQAGEKMNPARQAGIHAGLAICTRIVRIGSKAEKCMPRLCSKGSVGFGGNPSG